MDTSQRSPVSPHIAYNPDLFDDVTQWSFRELQKLAVKLGVNGKGRREDLIKRLKTWHKRPLIHYDRVKPMKNFSMVEAETQAKSPSLLSPIKSKPRRKLDGTPIGILTPGKQIPKMTYMQWLKSQHDCSNVNENDSKDNDEEDATSGVTKSTRKKSIKFSMFNGVQIIPPREEVHVRDNYEGLLTQQQMADMELAQDDDEEDADERSNEYFEADDYEEDGTQDNDDDDDDNDDDEDDDDNDDDDNDEEEEEEKQDSPSKNGSGVRYNYTIVNNANVPSEQDNGWQEADTIFKQMKFSDEEDTEEENNDENYNSSNTKRTQSNDEDDMKSKKSRTTPEKGGDFPSPRKNTPARRQSIGYKQQVVLQSPVRVSSLGGLQSPEKQHSNSNSNSPYSSNSNNNNNNNNNASGMEGLYVHLRGI